MFQPSVGNNSHHPTDGHRRGILMTSLLIAGCIVLQNTGFAAEAAIPPGVVDALKQNAAALSPITMKFTVNYTSEMGEEKALSIGKFWWGPFFFKPTVVDLQLDGIRFNCHREVTRAATDGSAVQMFFHNKFDGTDFYMVSRHPGTSPQTVVVPYETNRGFTDEMEYIHRAGFKRHDTMDLSRELNESLVLFNLSIGMTVIRAEPATVDGKELFLVEMKGDTTHEMTWLDPAKQYAVVIHDERNKGDERVRRTVCSDFEEFSDPNIWLPRQCDTDWYTWQEMGGKTIKEPLVHEVISVSKLDKTPTLLSDFQEGLDTPGLLVSDGRLGGKENPPFNTITYEVPANLNHLEGVIAAAIAGREYTPALVSNWKVKGLILINGLMVILGLLWMARRQKRRA